MIWFARLARVLMKLRFRLLGLATIKDISGDEFKTIFDRLAEQGWKLSSKYTGFDAGIDYDCLLMRKNFRTLKCEWDNWSEWSVEGAHRVIEAIALENRLPVTYAWRWTEMDESTNAAKHIDR